MFACEMHVERDYKYRVWFERGFCIYWDRFDLRGQRGNDRLYADFLFLISIDIVTWIWVTMTCFVFRTHEHFVRGDNPSSFSIIIVLFPSIYSTIKDYIPSIMIISINYYD